MSSSAGGSILQGIGNIIQGQAAKAAGKTQYNQLMKGADQTRREGAIAADLTIESGRRQAADNLVNAAASGGGTGGSSLTVLKDLERQITFQARNTIISSVNKARNLEYEARIAKRQGVLGETAGYINAGASFLDGLETVADNVGKAFTGGAGG